MMMAKGDQRGPWKELDWHHGLFEKKIPSSLSKVSRIWLLLRGITLWSMRNDLTFNNDIKWDMNKMQGNIWLGLLDYAWGKALKDSKKVAFVKNSSRCMHGWRYSKENPIVKGLSRTYFHQAKTNNAWQCRFDALSRAKATLSLSFKCIWVVTFNA